MAFDGTHINILDTSDDANVRMILPPSGDGQASTVYTYTVSGLSVGSGKAMTFDSPIGPADGELVLGTNEIDAIYLGSSEVDRVYWGDLEVWI